MLARLARLVVPVACPGCGLVDLPWCDGCTAPLVRQPRRVEEAAPRLDRMDDVPPLPTWAVADYTGPVRDLVVAWKDRERVDLDRLLEPVVARAAAAVGSSLRDVVGAGRVGVVPVPSSPAARRQRGRVPVAVLARGAVRGLRAAGLDADVVDGLRRRGRTRDQVGLGARARGRNQRGSVVAVPRLVVPGSVHVLVDDVLTTGATLAAAERALEGLDAGPAAALVLAATPPPGAVPEAVPEAVRGAVPGAVTKPPQRFRPPGFTSGTRWG